MSAINGLFSLFVCLPQTVVLLYKKCLDKICQGIYILTITDEKRRAERGCFLSAAFTPWRGRARARTSLKQTRKEKKAEYSAQTWARRAERAKKTHTAANGTKHFILYGTRKKAENSTWQ